MIKYHQNGVEPEYGDDHTLTNNWDTKKDYGNEYVQVYFRIDTPTYDYSGGFSNDNDRNNWNEEITKLIKTFNIFEGCSYEIERSKNKRAYLYSHPQNISGVILKNDVVKIATAISEMKLSSLRWVDLYDTVYLITDEEYQKYLTTKEKIIRKELFEKSSTSRTNKYYSVFDIARNIANVVRLPRLGLNDGVNYGGGQTINYIIYIINQMIEEGYLKEIIKDDCDYIRSLNKTEQKKSKLYFNFEE